MKRIRDAAFASLWGLSLAAGCASAPAATCPDGTASSSGSCSTTPAITMIAAEVVPPLPSLQAAMEIFPLTFDSAGSARVTLEAPAPLSGVVVDSDGQPVGLALVTVSRPSGIPGRPAVSAKAETDDAGKFSLALTPGDYTLRILPPAPNNAAQPPYTRAIHVAAGDGQANQESYQLPAPSSLTTVQGAVLNPIGGPLAGASVQAVDPTTGQLVSSLATTDDAGHYALAIEGEAAKGAAVRVVATVPGGKLPVLSLDVPLANHHAGDLATLRMPTLPASVTVALPIVGTSTSGARVTVPGARVDFSATLSEPKADVVATFTVTTVTSADGVATAQLVPGASTPRDYQVTVTPPVGSIFRLQTTSLPLVAGTPLAAAPVELATRPQLVGRLLDPTHKAVAMAVIAPQQLVSTVSAAPVATAAADSAVTDGTGGFSLRLDPGSYDVELVPPAGMALARWSFEQAISQDTNLGDVLLPPSTQNSVAVLSNGAPLAGVEVRLYEVTVDGSCKGSLVDCARPARLRAEGTTDNFGLVRVVLPAAAP